MSHSIQAHQRNENRTGKMVVVCSAVGGAGRTTVTVNLAAILAERNVKTTVLDADLQFGDLALALNLKPMLTIKEIVERKEFEHTTDYYTEHETGIRLIAAPVRPEYADLITTDMLVSIADSILAETEMLLVETQFGLTEQNLSLMEKADDILIVSNPGMAGLKNTKLMIETLDMLKMKDKTRLVINKSTASSVIKVADIPELVQAEQAYFLPDDPKHVPNSLDVGIPLVCSNPKLAFSKGMVNMVEQLFVSPPPAFENAGAGGILARIGKKAKEFQIRGDKDEFIDQTAIEESGGSTIS